MCPMHVRRLRDFVAYVLKVILIIFVFLFTYLGIYLSKFFVSDAMVGGGIRVIIVSCYIYTYLFYPYIIVLVPT